MNLKLLWILLYLKILYSDIFKDSFIWYFRKNWTKFEKQIVLSICIKHLKLKKNPIGNQFPKTLTPKWCTIYMIEILIYVKLLLLLLLQKEYI